MKIKVLVTTADKSQAGTDANVYLVIYGDKSQTGEMKLKNIWRNLFEQGK